MALPLHLVTRPDQIPHRLVLWVGHVNAREFPGPIEAGQLIGIPPVRLHPVARLARHLGGRHKDAPAPVTADKPAQRIPARPGLGP